MQAFLAVVAGASLVTALTVVTPDTLHAQRSLEISAFDADYVVTKAGQLIVTERITAHFSGQWNGMYRLIPVRYAMTNGTDYLIGLHIDDARDELGHVLRREESREGSYLKIKAWIPDANDATHTLTLKYTVENALRFFDEHDELYWNVTGNGWDYPIDSVTAHVTLPPGATGIRSGVYTGLLGATGRAATVTQSGGSTGVATTFATTQPLLMHEGMTIVEGWDRGAVIRPTTISKVIHFVKSNALMLMPLIALLLMYLLWRKFGRDAEVGSVVPRYDPPDNMSPGEVGTVIDMTVDPRDITATLVDLAVRGHIRINELPRGTIAGIPLGSEYTIERLTPASEHNKLKEHERLMLKGLFSRGHDLVSMDDLHNTFYTTLADIKITLYNGMMSAGYYNKDPELIRLKYAGIGILSFIAAQLIGSHLAVRNGFDRADIHIASALTGLVVALFGFLMPRRTVRGAQMLRQVMGFEEFLGRVDGDRMRKVIDSPELFEKYLPYAIALRVDKQWAAKFAGLTMPPPQWYSGTDTGVFHPAYFVDNVSHMGTAVGTTFASSPRSSSGSGFSSSDSGSSSSGGGGSSGGGFGGGGGGGF